jgi:hypothetical protein
MDLVQWFGQGSWPVAKMECSPGSEGARLKKILLAAVLLVMPLTAVAQDGTKPLVTDEDFHNFSLLSKQREAAAKAQLAKLPKSDVVAAIKTSLSDKTKIIYQQGYGVYVEFTDADGTDRMWFPGNRGVVVGLWEVQDKFWGPQACFHYYKSVNAVTGEPENSECVPAAQTVGNADVIDERPGDVFHLLNQIRLFSSYPEIIVRFDAIVGDRLSNA